MTSHREQYLALRARLQNYHTAQRNLLLTLPDNMRHEFFRAPAKGGAEAMSESLCIALLPEITSSTTRRDIFAPLSRFMNAELTEIRRERVRVRKRPQEGLLPKLEHAQSIARMRLSAVYNSKTPQNAKLSLYCEKNKPPKLTSERDGGMAYISANWLRSVDAHGIAVANWNSSDKVFVLSAARKSSAFLADMGVTVFDVIGVRLGRNAYQVEGNVFTFTAADVQHVIFNDNFRRGVAAVESIIEEEFSKVMEKVQ